MRNCADPKKHPPEVVDTGYGWNVFLPLMAGVTVNRRGVTDEHPKGRYMECRSHGLDGCRQVSAVYHKIERERENG